MKILVIRFSSIGDIVLTTPLVRCLKKQLGAEVHYLTKVAYQQVIAENPYIDRIISIEKEVDEVMSELKKEQYDTIIDLHNNLRTRRVQLALRKSVKRFRKLNFQKWLMVQFQRNYLPDVHIVDRYFETVLSLGVKNDGEGLDYFYPKEARTIFEPRFSSKPWTQIPAAYIAIAIGAAHFTKRIPKEKIIEICESINQNIVLLGGPLRAGRWRMDQRKIEGKSNQYLRLD